MSETSTSGMHDSIETNDEIDFLRIVYLALEHWYLFVLSVILCLIISYTYLWYTQPVYHMTATVLVEDGASDISQTILDEVGVGGKKRNIENEIAILNSRSLIEKAVSTLDLNINYTIDLGLRNKVLYANTPVKMDFVLSDDAPSKFVFSISISENSSDATLLYELVSGNGEATEHEQQIVLGEEFSNELGHFRILKTEFFDSMASGDSAVSHDYTLQYRSVEQLATAYMELLDVSEAREKASILRLKIEDKMPQRGVDILDAILRVYIQNNIEKKNQLASNSLQFIENQLKLTIDDLNKLEAEIKTFKVSHGVTDVSLEANFFLQQVGTLDKLVSEIDVKLSIINYLEKYISSDQDLKNASPSSLGIADPLLQKLIAQLSELHSERESMLRFTKEDNPLVKVVDTKILETKNALTNNIASIRSGLTASRQEMNEQLSVVEKKVQTLPKAEYELLALQRQYSIKESLYLLLLEKKSENSILLASTVSDNMVIDKAKSSEEPISPNKKMVYFAGLFAGLGIPSLFILLLMLVDNRVKHPDDLTRISKIPFLGVIPHNDKTDYIVVRDNNNTAIAESFRSIRTNISFLIRSNDLPANVSPKVIQLTSAMGSEGKSFCSINLASSLSLGGGKTILIGLDLRKPKLAEYFKFSNAVGASSVLAGLASVDEATLQTGIPNFDVMVGGPIPPNPAELLMGSGLGELLVKLEEKYDHIVLDTPPIGLVTDSLIISEHAATTIYVVRQNVTNASSLNYINDLYRTKKIRSVALLFNDVKATRFGYGYGYGYGYGNGYYAETAKPKGWKRFKSIFAS